MKNLLMIMAIILAAFTFQGCNNSGKGNVDYEDTSGIAQDTTTILNLTIDKEDSVFATNAANDGMAEVEMGNMAIKYGKSKQVKNFGVMMMKEHGKALIKLAVIAQSKKLTLPLTVDSAAQKKLAMLTAKKGSAFDKAYINMMIADNERDVQSLKIAATKVQDPDLRSYALKTIPILQKHLDAIHAIQDSMNH